MHRIIEVAAILGVSKVTVYKKISALKVELKPHLIKDKNITFLTDEGVALIRDSLKNVHYSTQQDLATTIYHDFNVSQMELLKTQLEKMEMECSEAYKSYFKELVNTYDYLKGVRKNKQDQLKSIQMAIEQIRSVNNGSRYI